MNEVTENPQVEAPANTAPGVEGSVSTDAPKGSAVEADNTPKQTEVDTGTKDAKVDTKTEAPKEDNFPSKYKNADGTPNYDKLAKAYVNLEKKLGAKGNIGATSIDEYAWQAPEDASIALDEQQVADFKKKALENGFSTKQYEFLMNAYTDVMGGVLDSMNLSEDKAKAALKEAWGSDYEQQVELAKSAFETFASSTANPNDPIWNHPEVMKLMARMGSELGEDTMFKKPAATATGIDDQIAELRKNPNYFNDPKLQAQMQALYDKKYK